MVDAEQPATPPDVARAKAALRITIRSARRDLLPDERRERSLRACERLQQLPELRDAGTVLLYAATDEECDPAPVRTRLLTVGTRVLLPRVVGDHLELAAAQDVNGLVTGAFGIAEPVGPRIDPAQVDVAVLPGLAFDRRGGRLGMGGGHFDRLLPLLREDCVRVGLAFSCQMAVRIPMAAHDEPVDVIVTDAAVHRIRALPPATA